MVLRFMNLLGLIRTSILLFASRIRHVLLPEQAPIWRGYFRR
jgi:hypothetical protein